ncbi:hypothetical protein Vadar_015936 [Vaccinium darrowii]|uniref:Uncharacterized protein n=1 Tax=Vaccinium darrowii TaxID=229202 RepID=A0ACB7YW56_9ERIC|nr:hypothetical protein Vadar_015936 [Vaccinium darrowii]
MQMDNDRNDANMTEVAVIKATTSVIVDGVAVLDISRYRNRTRIPNIPRAPLVNRDQARDSFINSILYASKLVRLPSGSTPSEIRNNRRFYPWFSDCVGAIDGTHIRASVPIEHQGRFRGQKGMTSQNVLAVVTFDLKFAYVLARWEGSTHDSRVLNDALSRSEGLQVLKAMTKKSEGKGKQFSWSKPMERVLLEVLADEVKIGNRPNNTFRTSSFNRVSTVIAKKFQVECSSDHIEHHLRIVKTAWGVIDQLRDKSGFGWDDNMKMITASPSVYT